MKIQPPKHALNFLRWFCREDFIEEIEGDLVELFEKRYTSASPTRAKWCFVWDVLRSFRPRYIRKFGANSFAPIMIRHYLRISGRSLIRNKMFSIINFTGLSIGITCCLILFIFVKYESSFDNFHPSSKETYRVVQHTKFPDQTLYWNTTAYPLAEALRNDFHEFELVTQTAGPVERFFTIERAGHEDAQFKSNFVLFVDPYYPSVFKLNWISGDERTAFNHIHSIVLTENLAKKSFGKNTPYPSMLGKTILLNGKDPLQVTGIVADAPGNTNLRYEMLIPYEFFKQNNPYPANNWSGNYQGTTFVVLPDNTKEQVDAEMNRWKKKYLKPEDDSRISYFLQPLESIHTETLYGSSPGGYTMSANILRTARFVGIFILLIAIANFVNLITAKSATRAKEVGIRKVIGSTWQDLTKQFIVENTLLVIISLAISIALTHILIGNLNAFLASINLQLALQWSHAQSLAALGGLTILLGTIYPATVLTAFSPIQILKNNVHVGNTRGFTVRKSLIVFQFAIVQLFVIGAIIVAAQMNYIKSKELGFSSNAVVMVPVPQFDKLDEFRNSLLQHARVNDVSFGSGPPMAVNGFALGTLYRLPNQTENEGLEAEMKIGDLNYLNFYNVEIINGRNFSANKNSFDEFIVNEKLVKSMGWTPEEAVGKTLTINEGVATIIGVTRDYHNTSLQNDITPCILVNWNAFLHQAFIEVKDVNPEAIAGIEKIWKKTFTASVFAYDFLDDSMEHEYLIENLSLTGVNIFSIVVISIGCLGLIGLMTFIALRKTKEVGIRKVLGASVVQLVVSLSGEFVFLIVVAFVIAVPLVYYSMQQWLEGFTYRIELSLWMFISGGIITLTIALLTSAYQAIKTAMINPVDSIRRE